MKSNLFGVFIALIAVEAFAATNPYTTLDFPGAVSTSLNGISGNVIVGAYSYVAANIPSHGFIYDGNNFTTIDYPGSTVTVLTDTDGHRVVGYYNLASRRHGFSYEDGVFTTIDHPLTNPLSANGSEISGISGNKIVGIYIDTSFKTHGYVFDGTTFTTLNNPFTTGTSTASAIDGSTIIGSYSSGGTIHGYTYDGTTYTKFDNPSGANDTLPLDVSGSSIVGYYLTASNATHGFLFKDGNFLTLEEPASLGDQLVAQGIDGRTIVGQYRSGGVYHGFVVTVPEPSLIVLVVAASMLFSLRRGRFSICIVLWMAIAGQSHVHANTVEEFFNGYRTPGRINTKGTAGNGWLTGWQGSALPKYTSGSQLKVYEPWFDEVGNSSDANQDGLAHSGSAPAYHLPNPDGVNPDSVARRSFSGFTGTVWISAVTILAEGFQPIGDGKGTILWLEPSVNGISGDNYIAIRGDTGTTTASLEPIVKYGGIADSSNNKAIGQGDVAVLLARLELDVGGSPNDSLTFWVDPQYTSDPANFEAQAVYAKSGTDAFGPSFDSIGLSFGPGLNLIDSIRISSSLQGAGFRFFVPEPSSSLILISASCVIACCLRRRRTGSWYVANSPDTIAKRGQRRK